MALVLAISGDCQDGGHAARFRWLAWFLAASCLLGSSSRNLPAQSVDSLTWDDLRQKTPWVFLGDSNTFSGGYVAVLDAWLSEANAASSVELAGRPKLLNLGMSSETASGLSEVDHPFQRPCVHQRLTKVLRMTRPGVVFVCYGMNDGIYQPFSEATFGSYQQGIRKLAAEVRASGARLVILTPPIFEAEVVRQLGKLGPAKTGRYAYFAPAEEYDEVLSRQAQWCLQTDLGADAVIDIRRTLLDEKQRRLRSDPEFSYSKDGIHFGASAHRAIARQILLRLGAPAPLLDAEPRSAAIERATDNMRVLRDAYLSATGKNRPKLAAGWPVWYAEALVARANQALTHEERHEVSNE